MEKKGIIYKCTNTINGKVYVGKTIQRPFSTYCARHISSAIRRADSRCKKPRKFYNAIRKYGKEVFVWEILEEVSKESLNEREIYYIDKYGTFKKGYNETLGGDGSLGVTYVRTPEIRAKISRSLTGKKRSKESVDKQRRTMSRENHPLFGKGHRASSIRKMRASKKGPNNPMAKIYEFISPEGERTIVKGGFNKFCSEHHLWHNAMTSVARGEKENHKGWKASIL